MQAEAIITNPKERRMLEHLAEYWEHLKGNRPFPSLINFGFGAVSGFRPHAFLLDLAGGYRDPEFRFVGINLTEECGGDVTHKPLSAAPGRTLLSKAAEHYFDVLANRAQLGRFEGELLNAHGERLIYRGIMLPFSEDGENIDVIVGAIAFRNLSEDDTAPADEAYEAPADETAVPAAAVQDLTEAETSTVDEAGADAHALAEEDTNEAASPAESRAQDVSAEDVAVQPSGGADGEPSAHTIDIGDTDSEARQDLSERLQSCQALARAADVAETRSRETLYTALESAYAFRFAAAEDEDGFQRICLENGILQQERAPFTPIVKLVFGTDYDKTRLSEYAATMSFAARNDVAAEEFKTFLKDNDGIKGCVQAERLARRKERGEDPERELDLALGLLRESRVLGEVVDENPSDSEFVIMLGRHADEGGKVQVLQILDEKENVVEAILKRAARRLKQGD